MNTASRWLGWKRIEYAVLPFKRLCREKRENEVTGRTIVVVYPAFVAWLARDVEEKICMEPESLLYDQLQQLKYWRILHYFRPA